MPRDRIDASLDPDLTDPAKVQQLLNGIDVPVLELRPVSTEVNPVATNKAGRCARW